MTRIRLSWIATVMFLATSLAPGQTPPPGGKAGGQRAGGPQGKREGKDGPDGHRPPPGAGPIEAFDTNKDGSISAEELSAGLASRQAALMKKADPDRHGADSAEELVKGVPH